jgi:phage terminase small subunit
MEPTAPLTPTAREYWDRHARRLRRAGILTRSDLDSFTVLCQTWAKVQELQAIPAGADNYREMVQLSNMLKQYHAFAKQFGLMPRERRQSKMDVNPPQKKDEFGL